MESEFQCLQYTDFSRGFLYRIEKLMEKNISFQNIHVCTVYTNLGDDAVIHALNETAVSIGKKEVQQL